MPSFPPASLVRAREREWVVLPSDNPDLLMLRPLGGSESGLTGIYLPLGLEAIEPAVFPLPNPTQAGDHTAARLLRDAARLSFRSGAGPFRSLGRVSVRPRPYQLVPLLTALRLDPVRLLVADDVGIGKTIEGALIARELLDRGEALRLAVICPPHLCDQWQRELAEKFHIEAVVVRSGTAARLERNLPPGDVSLFKHYRHLVVSVDYAKAERRRELFALDCPDLVIVDEAHTCARPAGRSVSQQQRHELLVKLAANPTRHLIMLTATPHSGIEDSFRSLLGLLNPKFVELDLAATTETQREQLAKQFVQRRRADVKRWLGEDTPFPDRDPDEVAYSLSPEYKKLFEDVYDFAQEIVRSGETLSGFKRRVRYWTALALLRCVMSSPAAAETALQARVERLTTDETDGADEVLFAGYVYDAIEETANDTAPAHVVDEGEVTLGESERNRLRSFARRAAALKGEADKKVETAAAEVDKLLKAGFSPILYCRYIATAEYVAEELNKRLGRKHKDCRIIAVTGADPEDVREARVAELSESPRRVLVATDCLSEGINLQEAFNAVIHYDLPWNPNRLEQREGRVDRYGQRAPQVKATLLYGRDNPIDGAVLDVLIRKAVAIRRALGVAVPVPMDSETVVEVVLKSLFVHGSAETQLSLLDQSDFTLESVHGEWDRAVEREKESRTRFAQRGIHPDEVAQELRETDAALGDPAAVERFVRHACQRLNAPLTPVTERGKPIEGVWLFNPANMPLAIKERVGQKPLRIAFAHDRPTPEGVTLIGRSSALTAALADYLLDTALDSAFPDPPAARCGLIRTRAVSKRTTLVILRARFLLESAKGEAQTLAEELVVCGFRGRPEAMPAPTATGMEAQVDWLTEEEAVQLLETAEPTANVTPDEHRRLLAESVVWLESLTPKFELLAHERAEKLLASHRRVRKITREGRVTVKPHLPVDVLGVYVLMPVPKGVK